MEVEDYFRLPVLKLLLELSKICVSFGLQSCPDLQVLE